MSHCTNTERLQKRVTEQLLSGIWRQKVCGPRKRHGTICQGKTRKSKKIRGMYLWKSNDHASIARNSRENLYTKKSTMNAVRNFPTSWLPLWATRLVALLLSSVATIYTSSHLNDRPTPLPTREDVVFFEAKICASPIGFQDRVHVD